MLLFEGQAQRLRVKVNDVLTLSAPTDRGVNNTTDVRVAAIARNVGLLSAFSAFIQADTLRQLYGLNARTTGAIHLYLRDPSRADTGRDAAPGDAREGRLAGDGSRGRSPTG